jgi:hypothetical protein
MIYFYVQAYLIVYKSSRRCGILTNKHLRQNNIETSHSDHNRPPKQTDKTFETSYNDNYEEGISQNALTESHPNTNSVRPQVFLISSVGMKVVNGKNGAIKNYCNNKSSPRSNRKDWHVAKIFILVNFAFEFLVFFGGMEGEGGQE